MTSRRRYRRSPAYTRIPIIPGILYINLSASGISLSFGSASTGAYPATKEDVFIEIVSEGGDTTGYQIPFNIHFTGNRTKGTFNPTTKEFTAEV